MASGLLLGRLAPGLDAALEAVRIGEMPLSVAVGLLVLMHPCRVIASAALGWFCLQVLPTTPDPPTTSAELSVGSIVVPAPVCPGIPLVAGLLTRTLGERAGGRGSDEDRFLPRLGPWGLDHARSTTVAVTAAGHNVELAIALAAFGVTSGRAPAGAVEAMAEEGVDMSAQTPEVLTDRAVRASDVMTTTGAATRARATPASPARTGSRRTQPAGTWTPSAGSATISKPGCRR